MSSLTNRPATSPQLTAAASAAAPAPLKPLNPIQTLTLHWPEYLMEAFGLGAFMVSACTFGIVLEHPESPLRQMLDSPLLRRWLMGIAMGLTAVAIIYSPWGKRSGAHINPAITLTFFRLGKVKPWDALFYVAAQFAGAAAGVGAVAALAMPALADPAVNFVATLPGSDGLLVAFVAETLISFGIVSVVLGCASTPRLESFAGLAAGTLVMLYITFEAPLSGMSMNAARSFGSALFAQNWTAFWIYLSAPLLGMLAAAETHLIFHQRRAVVCAKLHHRNRQRCIFCGCNGGI